MLTLLFVPGRLDGVPRPVVERVAGLQDGGSRSRLEGIVEYSIDHVDGFVIVVVLHPHREKNSVLHGRVETELVFRTEGKKMKFNFVVVVVIYPKHLIKHQER